ncbi:MAG: hypothetical protein J6Q48_07410 [Bacteroidaceae bacterium]|nr:hypothetical protein [Bacteroidaceae bacterium]
MYTVTIKEASREFTARERIAFKDTSNALQLDNILGDNESLEIVPVDYVILDVVNGADNEQYEKIIVIDSTGTKYVTGSSSFKTAFMSIWSEMVAETEPYSITIYKKESKNYKGKSFITCSIVA